MHPHTKEWLDDLRDPDSQSKQGMCRLQSGADKFCCLGRLCLVAERHGASVKRTPTGRIQGTTLKDQPHVHSWAESRMYVNGDVYVMRHNVACYNDSDGLTFAQIADRIDPQ